jgi:hypothetical protein
MIEFNNSSNNKSQISKFLKLIKDNDDINREINKLDFIYNLEKINQNKKSEIITFLESINKKNDINKKKEINEKIKKLNNKSNTDYKIIVFLELIKDNNNINNEIGKLEMINKNNYSKIVDFLRLLRDIIDINNKFEGRYKDLCLNIQNINEISQKFKKLEEKLWKIRNSL